MLNDDVIKTQKTILVQSLVERIKRESKPDYMIAQFKNIYALTEIECEAIRTSLEETETYNPDERIKELSRENAELKAQIDNLKNPYGQTIDVAFLDDQQNEVQCEATARPFYNGYALDYNTSYTLTRIDTTPNNFYYVSQPFPVTYYEPTSFPAINFPESNPPIFNFDAIYKYKPISLPAFNIQFDKAKIEDEMTGPSLADPARCDCGAEKAGTTHANWCSTNE